MKTYGDDFGHPGCYGCQICWANDPAMQAALDDPNLGKGDPAVDSEAWTTMRVLEDLGGSQCLLCPCGEVFWSDGFTGENCWADGQLRLFSQCPKCKKVAKP